MRALIAVWAVALLAIAGLSGGTQRADAVGIPSYAAYLAVHPVNVIPTGPNTGFAVGTYSFFVTRQGVLITWRAALVVLGRAGKPAVIVTETPTQSVRYTKGWHTHSITGLCVPRRLRKPGTQVWRTAVTLTASWRGKTDSAAGSSIPRAIAC